MTVPFRSLAYEDLDELVFGRAKKPLAFSNGVIIGGGTVYPEVNFTLPMMTISEGTMGEVRRQYEEMATGVCQRAVDLEVPGLVIEVELLPPLTMEPTWGVEVTKVVKGVLAEFAAKHQLPGLLRMTPVDIREGAVEHMWRGRQWELLMKSFQGCAEAGADLLAIESVGGKHLHDNAVMYGDIAQSLFALGVVGTKDMERLWSGIASVAQSTNTIASGDTACGFANTAMVLADRGYVSKTFSAVVRVISAVRSLAAYSQGAVGPHKDCGYEGVYVKAITGTPISMEGRTSACAHLSTVGNIAGALADLWSNESVENVKLLSGMAPTVYLEQLAYDCRLFNTATANERELMLRDLLVESDSALDPQAYVLRPDVVLAISAEVVKGRSWYEQAKIAALQGITVLRSAAQNGQLNLNEREAAYLDRMEAQVAAMEDSEEAFTNRMLQESAAVDFDPAKYDM